MEVSARRLLLALGAPVVVALVILGGLVAGGAGRPAYADPITYTYADFSGTTGLTLVGNATATGGAIALTTAAASERGAVFLNTPISLAGGASFHSAFTFAFTAPGGAGQAEDAPGADGMTFLVQPASAPLQVGGGAGGGSLGYGGLGTSVAAEFDTWTNSNWGDVDGNHVGIDLNGSVTSVAQQPVTPDLNNGNTWYAWVDYDGATHLLEVRVSEHATRPSAATVSTTIDIAADLGTDSAVAGFTAATGASWQNHLLQSWTLTSEPAATPPAPADSTFTVDTRADAPDAAPGDGVCATAAGTCSLRAAIMEANADVGADTIAFAIGGGGAQTITPANALPAITRATVIDATTQPGYAGTPLITLDGSHLTGSAPGLEIAGNRGTVRGLAINGFPGPGILVSGARNTIAGNVIGADATGTTALPNSAGVDVRGANNTIGPDNVISGNTGSGVDLLDAGASGNVVDGNDIGTTADGTGALPNGGAGVRIVGASSNTIGGAAAGAGNVISGNADRGIQIATNNNVGSAADHNLVQGNHIGTDRTGTLPLGNGGAGINISNTADDPSLPGASDNQIGGDGAGEGNVIAFSSTHGIRVRAGTGDAILGNSIHSNAALGIDLRPAGEAANQVTANDSGDADAGPNDVQNFPVITGVTGGSVIAGTLDSTPSATFHVELFRNDQPDASGYGEGQTFLGSVTVVTDESGQGLFTFDAGQSLAASWVTATATDDAGDTSEFSQAFPVNGPPVDVDLTLSAGVAQTPPAVTGGIPIADIPLDQIPPGTPGFASVPLSSIPLRPSDVGSSPLSSIPLSSIPLSSIAVGASPLSSIPLSSIPIDAAGGWGSVLAGTALADLPLQSVTLGDLLSLNPPPAGLDALHLDQIDLGSTPLSSISLTSVALAGLPLSSIPLSSIDLSASPLSSIPLSSIAAGADQIFDCSIANCGPGGDTVASAIIKGALLNSTTLMSMELAGIPLSSIPLSSIPLSSIDLGSTPLSSIPLSSIDLGATPLSSIPLSSIALSSIPLSSIPLSSIPLSSIPLSSIPLSSIPLSSIPLSSIPLSSIPLSSIPLSSIGTLVDCNAIDCSTATLADAVTQGALDPSATLGTLVEQLGLSSENPSVLTLVLTLGGTQLGDIDPALLANVTLGEIGDFGATGRVGSAPLSSIPLSSIDIGSTPLSSIPLSSIPLSSIPLSSIPLSSIPLSSIDLSASPLSSIPLSSIPLSSIGTLVDCGANAQAAAICNDPGNYTLGDVGDADAIAPSADAALLLDELGSFTLGDLRAYGDVTLGELSSVPLSSIPLSSIPLSSIDVASSPLSSIPLKPLVLDTVPLSSIPLSSIPLSSIAVGASPLSSIPLSSIPLSSITIVDCAHPELDCATATLGDAADAGALLPGATLGDIVDALAGFTLGQLGAYGDVTLGDLGQPLLVAVLRGLIQHRADYPWEDLPLDQVDVGAIVNGPVVPYAVDFTPHGGGPSFDLTVAVALPAGFRYVRGSATLDGAPAADAEVQGDRVIFRLPGLHPEQPHHLAFNARPGLRLGTFTASASVASGGFATGRLHVAPVTVVENLEPNDTPAQATTAHPDELYVSYINRSADNDIYSIPTAGIPDGAHIAVFLSHLGSDNDLAMYRPVPDRSVTSVPLRPIPLQGQPVEDPGLSSGGDTTPDTTADIALQSLPIASLSTNRGTSDEGVAAVSTGGVDHYLADVTGYGGATSDEPYVLRVKVVEPSIAPVCAAPTLPFAGQGATTLTIPASLPASTNTLFLLDQRRLGDLYGSVAVGNILTAIDGILHPTGGANLGVDGAVIPVDASAAVSAAYAAWDANPCNPDTANGVVDAIVGLIADLRSANGGLPNLQSIVIVGDDTVIPLARIPDLTRVSNETSYAPTFAGSNIAVLGSMATGHVLSDDPYGTFEPIPWFDRELFVPQVGVGRLVETPDDIVTALDDFVTAGGHLDPTTALTTGYDFLADGASAVGDALTADGIGTVDRLINDVWTRQDLENALLPSSGAAPGIASINAHFDHQRALPAIGNTTGSETDLVLLSDILPAIRSDLQGAILFSMGCHAGLSVSDIQVGIGDPRGLDWAQAFVGAGGVFVGNTGYGYGDTATVALSERLMTLFAQRLDGTLSLGRALAFAKQDYAASLGLFGVYDEKALVEATFYGLPMYRLGPAAPVPPAPPAPPATNPTTDPFTGLAFSTISATPTFTQNNTPRGVYFSINGQTQVTHYRPIEPRFQVDNIAPDGTVAHGALLTSLVSQDQPIDPVVARPTIDLSAHEPEPPVGQAFFPAQLQSIATYQAPTDTGSTQRQRLNVIAGQFIASSTPGATTGTQRLFTAFDTQVLYSGSADFIPPTIARVDAITDGGFVTFRVVATDTVDAAGTPGTVKRVLVLYKPSNVPSGTSVAWSAIDLTPVPGDPTTWTGSALAFGGEQDYFVQAVDAAGNVAVSSNKGKLHEATAPIATAPSAGLSVTVSPPAPGSIWHDGSATVSITGSAAPFTVSIDGGAAATYPGSATIPLAGDGLHTLAVSASDGEQQTVVVPVDSAPPTIVLGAPLDGGTVGYQSTALANYECLDGSSGVASCTASVADGDPLDTSALGTFSFTITATDQLGHTTTRTATYTVADLEPPVIAAPDALTMVSQTYTGTPNPDTLGRIAPVLAAATATDDVDGAVAVTNDAPAFFPLGTTTVTFSATDAAGNTGTATVDVTVNPATDIATLQDSLVAYGVTGGLAKDLGNKLKNAQKALDRDSHDAHDTHGEQGKPDHEAKPKPSPNTTEACKQVVDFVQSVLDAAGKQKLLTAQAVPLAAQGNQVLDAFGCQGADPVNAQAEEDLLGLVDLIGGMSLDHGLTRDLQGSAGDAAKQLAHGQNACDNLDSMLKQINEQAGKKKPGLDTVQAATLTAAVNAIESELGCHGQPRHGHDSGHGQDDGHGAGATKPTKDDGHH